MGLEVLVRIRRARIIAIAEEIQVGKLFLVLSRCCGVTHVVVVSSLLLLFLLLLPRCFCFCGCCFPVVSIVVLGGDGGDGGDGGGDGGKVVVALMNTKSEISTGFLTHLLFFISHSDH